MSGGLVLESDTETYKLDPEMKYNKVKMLVRAKSLVKPTGFGDTLTFQFK